MKHVVVFIAMFLALAPPAGATVFGVQDDQSMLDSSLTPVAIARGHHLDAKAFRVIVRGSRGLDAYEPAMQLVCTAGFRVQVTLTDWTDLSFVREAIQRWGGCVNAWSFWNEPDLTGDRWFRAYAGRHLAGLRLARELDPSARVLVGETSPHATLHALRRLARLPGDGLAIHPYQNSTPLRPPTDMRWPTGIGMLKTISRHSRLPIYITEFGYQPAMQYFWPRAMRVARMNHVREVVAYQLVSGGGSRWDTSLYDYLGRPRAGARALREESR